MNLIIIFLNLLIPTAVFAVCPICTFAVGAGIGLAQYFGIDDTITGIWIGGLIVSMIVWTIYLLDKKNVHFYGRKISIIIVYYCATIIPLYVYGIMGHELNKLWGADKILVGIIFGSVFFFIGIMGHNLLKRSYFPFQKVVIPVLPLIILSVFFYYLINE